MGSGISKELGKYFPVISDFSLREGPQNLSYSFLCPHYPQRPREGSVFLVAMPFFSHPGVREGAGFPRGSMDESELSGASHVSKHKGYPPGNTQNMGEAMEDMVSFRTEWEIPRVQCGVCS